MSEGRAAAVQYWWSMAEQSLDSARRDDAQAFVFAVNRLYYAAFYGVSALLLDRGLDFKKHSGVRACFHRELVKAGEVEVEWGRFYDRLFDDRQEADYLVLVAFERGYVGEQLETCGAFLKRIKPLVGGPG